MSRNSPEILKKAQEIPIFTVPYYHQMKRFILTLVISCAFLPLTMASGSRAEKKLIIGITYAPPYILYKDGIMSGVCIDLWRLIGDTLKISYEYKVYSSTDTLMHDLQAGAIDLSILPLTATSERLAKLKLSIPFYISNMGIATRIEKQSAFIQLIKNIFSWKIIRSLLFIALIATVFAVFLWLAERKGNALQFRPGFIGVTDGIWWAFVTMTTVGYGDKIPKTRVGRILAIFWMFFAIGLFFIASGVVSSELTVNRLQSQIKNPDDLSSCRVGAVYKSGYAETLSRHSIPFSTFSSPWDGLQAVNSGIVDAFVYDQALLQYLVTKNKLNNKIVIIASGLNMQYFSYMAGKNNQALIDRINPALLKVIDSDAWGEILSRYGIAH